MNTLVTASVGLYHTTEKDCTKRRYYLQVITAEQQSSYLISISWRAWMEIQERDSVLSEEIPPVVERKNTINKKCS